MSKFTPAGLGDFHFWIYGASLAVLLAELIGIVEQMDDDQRPRWWPEVVGELRRDAAVGDYFFDVGQELNHPEHLELANLYELAADRVEQRGTLTPDEAAAWIILDDLPLIFRGDQPVDTTPVAQLGHALSELIRSGLPAAPQGHLWYYGIPGGPKTIPMPSR
jgi:hypothetical protein